MRILPFLVFFLGSLTINAQITIKSDEILNCNAFVEFVKVADLNDDGRDDVVAAMSTGSQQFAENRLMVFYQDSSGQLLFGDSLYFNFRNSLVQRRPKSLDVGDLNADGKTDILVGYDDKFAIFFQDSSGFQPAFRTTLNDYMSKLAIGDLNKDQLNDIVVGLGSNNEFQVFYQNSNGFADSSYTNELSSRADIEIADINGDQLNDLAFSNGGFDFGIQLYMQDTNGLLQKDSLIAPLPNSRDNNPWSFAIEDLNNDGKADFCIAPNGQINNQDVIYIAFQDPNSSRFDSLQFINVPGHPKAIETADLNCDGKAEILINYGRSQFLGIYEQNDNARYELKSTAYYPTFNSTHPEPQSIAVGYLDLDSRPDIASGGLMHAVNLVYNRSIPKSFNQIDTVVNTQRSYHGWARKVYPFYTDTILDTIPDYILSHVNYYRPYDSLEIDSLFIDSTFQRYGNICGDPYSDTVSFDYQIFDSTLVDSDTALIFTLTDSLFFIGLEEYENLKVSLYPNPTKGQFSLTSEVALINAILRLYDLKGRLLLETPLPNKRRFDFDLRQYPGNHLLEIKSANGLVRERILILK